VLNLSGSGGKTIASPGDNGPPAPNQIRLLAYSADLACCEAGETKLWGRSGVNHGRWPGSPTRPPAPRLPRSQSLKQESRPMSPSSQPCGVLAYDLGDRTVLRFTGRRVMLDEQNTGIVGEHLLALVGGLKAGRLEMDFGNVTYLNSSALGLFVLLHKRLRARGGRLVVCNLAPQVYEVFEVTKLHTLFDIRPQAG
jgi:anti-anti-sigma factor